MHIDINWIHQCVNEQELVNLYDASPGFALEMSHTSAFIIFYSFGLSISVSVCCLLRGGAGTLPNNF